MKPNGILASFFHCCLIRSEKLSHFHNNRHFHGFILLWLYTDCENHKFKSREIICWFTVFFRYCKLFTNAHTATTLCTLSCTTLFKKTNLNLTKSDIILHFVKMFHQLSFFQIAIFKSNFVECVHFVENSVSRTYLTNSQY